MTKNNFTTIMKNGMKLVVNNDYKDDLLKIGIEDIDNLLKNAGGRVIDDVDKSTVISLRLNRPAGEEKIAVKYYDKPELKRKLKDFFRTSKAMKEWIVGNRLAALGIPVPLPLAAGERRVRRVLRDSFLISRELESAENIREYIFRLRPPLSAETRRRKREMTAFLAAEIAAAHEKGFFHGDLNTSHIMVRNEKEGKPDFYFVDFESSRLSKSITDKERVKDLARLNMSMPGFITRTDKWRFFKAYSRNNRMIESRSKKLIGKIMRRTLEKTKNITTVQ